MLETLSPYVSQLFTLLVQVAALVLFYWLSILRRKVEDYVSANLKGKEMELVGLIGKQSYAFAETAYRGLDGPDKLSHALDYFEKRVKARGITFDMDEAKEAVERAWLEMEGIPKRFQAEVKHSKNTE